MDHTPQPPLPSGVLLRVSARECELQWENPVWGSAVFWYFDAADHPAMGGGKVTRGRSLDPLIAVWKTAHPPRPGLLGKQEISFYCSCVTAYSGLLVRTVSLTLITWTDIRVEFRAIKLYANPRYTWWTIFLKHMWCQGPILQLFQRNCLGNSFSRCWVSQIRICKFSLKEEKSFNVLKTDFVVEALNITLHMNSI